LIKDSSKAILIAYMAPKTAERVSSSRTLDILSSEIKPNISLLVERARRGDYSAFEQLLKSYEKVAFNLANKTLKNPEYAKDAVQNAKISAFKNLDKLKDTLSFRSYFLRIVLNESIDMLRADKRRSHVSDDQIIGYVTDPSNLNHHIFHKDIIRALECELRTDYFELISMADIDKISYKEIASILNVPMGTVRSKLHQARKHARRILIAKGFAQPN
jgi:RNA polymerase sigma-70 factor (ECF subfamily)